MPREIRCTVTDEEYADIVAYVAKKRRWRRVSHFLRDACFRAMAYNPAGRHDRASVRRTPTPSKANRKGV
jgi:hypothetical protein